MNWKLIKKRKNCMFIYFRTDKIEKIVLQSPKLLESRIWTNVPFAWCHSRCSDMLFIINILWTWFHIISYQLAYNLLSYVQKSSFGIVYQLWIHYQIDGPQITTISFLSIPGISPLINHAISVLSILLVSPIKFIHYWVIPVFFV